jgi:predicted AlkP superfamily phosphohydrolase/phosphomutase
MKAKVLFIGLDSAEPDLIMQWSEAGLLPTFQSLKNTSAWGAATTPPGFSNGVTWPSLFTGVSPAKHGRYYFRQIVPGTYQMAKFQDDDLKHEPFWNVLSQANRRVGIIDMVRASLSKNLNGIQLVDWMTHDRVSPPRSWPPALEAEATAQFGADPFDGCCEGFDQKGPAGYKALRDGLLERVETKTNLSCHYLDQGGWDLFMTVFADPHDVGHQCWHLHDPTHPKHDPALARSLGDPLKDVYIAIDRAVGRLLESVGSETTVILFTGPGMGPNYTGNSLMDEILYRLERGPVTRGVAIMDTLKFAYKAIVPPAYRKRSRRSSKSAAPHNHQAKRGHNWSQRKCFAVHHNKNSGAVRINLVGREPNGQVNPGAEYDAFCTALTQDLLNLVNLNTGKPLVQEVIRIADLYQGEYLDSLPDLLVVWSQDAPISAIGSPKVGKIIEKELGGRTGGHTPHCLFFARGPGVEPGELPQPVLVEDFAPTIASLLEVPLPSVDGKPIAALFRTSTRTSI